MKVLMLNGSPHKNGCTFTALSVVAKELESEGIESEILWIGSKPISGCIGCGGCAKLQRCAVSDDVSEFLEKAKTADAFVLGSPVHYAGVSGAIKSFLDRAFYSGSRMENGNLFRHKPGAAVVSARRAGTTYTYDQLIKYFGINEMPIISSNYWNMVHGSNPEQVMQDEEGVQVMRLLGKNMAYFLKCIKAGKENGVVAPEKENKLYTNFIR